MVKLFGMCGRRTSKSWLVEGWSCSRLWVRIVLIDPDDYPLTRSLSSSPYRNRGATIEVQARSGLSNVSAKPAPNQSHTIEPQSPRLSGVKPSPLARSRATGYQPTDYCSMRGGPSGLPTMSAIPNLPVRLQWRMEIRGIREPSFGGEMMLQGNHQIG